MTRYTREEAAEGAGIEPAYVDRLVELGIVAAVDETYSAGDVRRILTTKTVEDAGISIEGMAAALHRGEVSLDYLDTFAYERFAAFAPETFRDVAQRTGVPLELVTLIREAIGAAQPSPDDRMRVDELAVVPFLEMQVAEGFRHVAIERLIRVYG